ncbi:hypothetical protein TeGR_g3412, partial [Tetraparma gracilis]
PRPPGKRAGRGLGGLDAAAAADPPPPPASAASDPSQDPVIRTCRCNDCYNKDPSLSRPPLPVLASALTLGQVSAPSEATLGRVLSRRIASVRSIVERNPLGFETKFDTGGAAGEGGGGKGVQHKLGCKCRKSRCLKKYCECYHRSARCSLNCRCIDCQNGGPTSALPPQHEEDGEIEEEAGVWMVDAAMELSALKRVGNTEDIMAQVSDSLLHNPPQLNRSKSARSNTPSPTTTSASSSSSSILNTPIKPAPILTTSTSVPVSDAEKQAIADSMMAAALAMTELYSNGGAESGGAGGGVDAYLKPNAKSPKRRAQSIVRSEASSSQSDDDGTSSNATGTDDDKDEDDVSGGGRSKRANNNRLTVDTTADGEEDRPSGITPSVIIGVGGMDVR